MKRLSSLVVASVLALSASAVAAPQPLCDDHGKKDTKDDKKDDKENKDAKGGDTKPKPPAFY
jgi:hypothetical protein